MILPPEMATVLQRQLGEDLLRFGDARAAREHFHRALALATEFGFSALVIEADQLLKAARTGSRERAVPSVEQVAEIRSALAALESG